MEPLTLTPNAYRPPAGLIERLPRPSGSPYASPSTRYFVLSTGSGRSQSLEKLHHLNVIRIGRIVIVPDVRVELRRLQDQRDPPRAWVGEEPAERLRADRPVADEHVAILVGAECALAVIEVEEARCLAGRLLERVQRPLHLGLRRAQVIAAREQVAGVEPVARARPQRLRHVREDRPDFLGRAGHRAPCPGGVLDEKPRA